MARSFKESMGFALDLSALIDVHEGMRFDLGGWIFDVYAVPGHSVGSMVLFDESRGLLIAGDGTVTGALTGPAAAIRCDPARWTPVRKPCMAALEEGREKQR